MTRPLLHWTSSVLTIPTATLLLLDSLCVDYVITKPTHCFCTLSTQGPGPVPRCNFPPIFTSVEALGPLCLFCFPLIFCTPAAKPPG